MAKHRNIGLGDLAKDNVTGFTGVVIAATEWLNGCRRLVLQPRELDEKGGVKSSETFDETQLTVVESGVVPGQNSVEATPAKRTGGPRDDAAALRRA